MRKLTTKEFWWIFWIELFVVVCLWAATSHAAVGKKHDNSLGVPMFFDNPMTYKAGAVTAVAYIKDGLVVRIQPIGTYSLFTEDILICGASPVMFVNKTNPMVLTYRTKASKMLEGVGCHELVSVESLKTTKELE
jgi:hypothetical protein